MGYMVSFVGLVYFSAAGKGREVLLPDGRSTGNEAIPPHEAVISIPSSHFLEGNWPDDDGNTTRETPLPTSTRRFPIRDSVTLSISSTKTNGEGLDTTRHDGCLPSLRALGVNVDFDNAETIARMNLDAGVLAAYRLPTTPDELPGAIVSQWRVTDNSRGPVTITATAKDGSTQTLIVARATEIVLANISDLLDDETSVENGHFQLFRKLAPGSPAILKIPRTTADLRPFISGHPFFLRDSNTPGEPCSNNCC